MLTTLQKQAIHILNTEMGRSNDLIKTTEEVCITIQGNLSEYLALILCIAESSW